MKKSFLIMLISASISFAQTLEVVNVEQVTNLEQGEFYYPIGNYDDSKLLFSSENYTGLWILDNQTGKVVDISNGIAAGYEPSFTTNDKVIFRNDTFINNKRFIAIMEYDLVKLEKKEIDSELRNISQIKVTNGNMVTYSQNQNLIGIKESEKLVNKVSSYVPVVMIENSDLVLYQNGNRNVLNPFGDGNYLWASVSPDGGKLLFTFAGKGSFVTDLNGSKILEVQDAHYPQWSNNGEWITYMKDYDDGENVISSDLFVMSINKKEEINITNTEDIHEMYPVWAKSKDVIYCSSTVGVIYKIELKLN